MDYTDYSRCFVESKNMLTFEDCLALSHLSDEDVSAVAEHEHIPEITAIEYGDYLIQGPGGELLIQRIILDDIEHSRANGNNKHAKELESVLENFVLNHARQKSQYKQSVK